MAHNHYEIGDSVSGIERGVINQFNAATREKFARMQSYLPAPD